MTSAECYMRHADTSIAAVTAPCTRRSPRLACPYASRGLATAPSTPSTTSSVVTSSFFWLAPLALWCRVQRNTD